MHYFGLGAKDALERFLTDESNALAQGPSSPDFQIVLKSEQLPESLRNLTADHVNKLIKVTWIRNITASLDLANIIVLWMGVGAWHSH